MKNLFLTCVLVGSASLGGFSQSVYAQNISERLDLPEWSDGINVTAAFVNNSMDFDSPGMNDIDSQGVQIEVSNDYKIDELWTTQSALIGRVTSTGDEAIEVDNKSIGLTQRFIRKFAAGSMWFKPSLGVGVNYGGLEYGPIDNAEDQNYVSYSGEAALRLDTAKGFAPFASYTYEIADRENTSASLDIQSISAGIAIVF